MTDKEKIHQILSSLWKNDDSVGKTYYNQALQDVQTAIDLQEEPVSEDLEDAAKYCIPDESYHMTIESEGEGSGENVYDYVQMIDMFKAGSKWQKANLWKPADGDELPEIDREVIAILNNGKVMFAHRPPEYWDGKDIVTGKVTRYYPKIYDKGGWNIPDVKFWLDVELPKEIEL